MFLVGEGKNDIGGLAHVGFQTDDAGFMQPLIERLSRHPVGIRGQKVASLPKRRGRGPRDVVERSAFVAAQIAAFDEAEVLVYVTDVDSEPGKAGQASAERRMETLRRLIERGAHKANTSLRVVVGTPLRTVEAWALGDVEAVEHVSGRGGLRLPKQPEHLWGRPHDPASNHPKQVLHRQFGGPPGSHSYAAIGSRARIDELERTCPKSFLPFAQQVQAALS